MNKTYPTLMLIVFVLGCGANFFAVKNSRAGEPTTAVITESAPTASRLSKEIRRAADRAAPGLVTVYALRGPRMTRPWRLRESAKTEQRFPGNGNQFAASSLALSPDEQGSGIVLDSKGYILTCSHVVAGADAVFIRTADGRKIHADEVHCDPESDLALIRIHGASDLNEVSLGDSDELDVGDWVVSLASPYDLEESVSAGIVSSTKRWVESSSQPLIQSDAATNPGSSGGALLNLQGEVVGIIVGGFCTSEGFQGIGFATPINIVKDVAKQLRSNGYVRRVDFGIQAQPITTEMASSLELSLDAGWYVIDVRPNSPANSAGLKEGDVITAFDGKSINQSFDPQSLNTEITLGNSYPISLFRDHKAIELELKTGQAPRTFAVTTALELPPTGSFEYYDSVRGLGLSQLTSALVDDLELPQDAQGVLVTHVAFESDAYREGVAAGMVIARINEKAVESLDEYREITGNLILDNPLLLLLHSNQGKQLVILPMSHGLKNE